MYQVKNVAFSFSCSLHLMSILEDNKDAGVFWTKGWYFNLWENSRRLAGRIANMLRWLATCCVKKHIHHSNHLALCVWQAEHLGSDNIGLWWTPALLWERTKHSGKLHLQKAQIYRQKHQVQKFSFFGYFLLSSKDRPPSCLHASAWMLLHAWCLVREIMTINLLFAF